MSLLSISKNPLSESLQNEYIKDLYRDIVVLPGILQALLFGSAASLTMSDQSDMDILLIFDSNENLRLARKKYYSSVGSTKTPRDIIWKTQDIFNKEKELGGISMIAFDSGKNILEKYDERS